MVETAERNENSENKKREEQIENADYEEQTENSNTTQSEESKEVFAKFRRLCGVRELTEAQEIRLARLVDIFGMTDIVEFQHMILSLEYYLYKSEELFEKSLNTTKELFNSECTDSIAQKLESAMSRKLTDAVIEQANIRSKEIVLASNLKKYAAFIFSFSIFGILFFITGLLSHGKGIPPWISSITIGSGSLLELLLSLFLGLPMSWILWIGGGITAILMISEKLSNAPATKIGQLLWGNKWKICVICVGVFVIWELVAWLK